MERLSIAVTDVPPIRIVNDDAADSNSDDSNRGGRFRSKRVSAPSPITPYTLMSPAKEARLEAQNEEHAVRASMSCQPLPRPAGCNAARPSVVSSSSRASFADPASRRSCCEVSLMASSSGATTGPSLFSSVCSADDLTVGIASAGRQPPLHGGAVTQLNCDVDVSPSNCSTGGSSSRGGGARLSKCKRKIMQTMSTPAFDMTLIEETRHEDMLAEVCNAATCHPLSEISDLLCLGTWKDASDAALLARHGITHVLNVAKEVDPQHSSSGEDNNTNNSHCCCDIVSASIPMSDCHSQDLDGNFDTAFRFIEEARERKGRVLVHCRRGISRSAAIVVAYLMASEGLSFSDAHQCVLSRRPCVCLNLAFQEKLSDYQPSDSLWQRGGGGGVTTKRPSNLGFGSARRLQLTDSRGFGDDHSVSSGDDNSCFAEEPCSPLGLLSSRPPYATASGSAFDNMDVDDDDLHSNHRQGTNSNNNNNINIHAHSNGVAEPSSSGGFMSGYFERRCSEREDGFSACTTHSVSMSVTPSTNNSNITMAHSQGGHFSDISHDISNVISRFSDTFPAEPMMGSSMSPVPPRE